MMQLLVQHNEALKRAARLIVDYERRLGVIALTDDDPAAAILPEIQQALAAFHHWHKWQGQHEQARAALLQMWASGKWTNRDTCARLCYRQAGFNNMAIARQALVGAPAPEPSVVRRQRVVWIEP